MRYPPIYLDLERRMRCSESQNCAYVVFVDNEIISPPMLQPDVEQALLEVNVSPRLKGLMPRNMSIYKRLVNDGEDEDKVLEKFQLSRDHCRKIVVRICKAILKRTQNEQRGEQAC